MSTATSRGGRPRILPEDAHRVSFMVPRDLLARVDHAAGEAGLSRAEWVRDALLAHARNAE